jgi:hypothetical protein
MEFSLVFIVLDQNSYFFFKLPAYVLWFVSVRQHVVLHLTLRDYELPHHYIRG